MPPLHEALAGQAHVWLTPVDALGHRIGDYQRLLSAEERGRFERYRRESDRRLFLIAHALLRTTLSRYLPVSPEAWSFERGPYGRPEIVGPTGPRPIRFNLSHAPGMAACVVTSFVDCGVDVEDSTRIDEPLVIAGDVFSASEQAALSDCDAATMRARFFAIWTLKEAYIKARGLGLAIPLKNFTLLPDTPVRLRSVESPPQQPSDWQLELLSLPAPHVAAVALRSGREPLSIVTRSVTPRDLVKV